MSGENWRLRAACREADPEAFFPVSGIRATREDCAEALAYCGRCEVTEECLEYALTHRAQGVWGNTTDFERDAMTRQSRRAEREAVA